MANMSQSRTRLIRWRYLVAAAIVAACGLVWRLAPLGLPPFWIKYGGSILWGVMVLLIVAAFARTARTTLLAAATIALAAELFRLFHTPALDAFRLTLPGALLFGRVFSPWNILAYWIGIAAAYPFARPGADPRP